jgi:hypothetical protein
MHLGRAKFGRRAKQPPGRPDGKRAGIRGNADQALAAGGERSARKCQGNVRGDGQPRAAEHESQ